MVNQAIFDDAHAAALLNDKQTAAAVGGGCGARVGTDPVGLGRGTAVSTLTACSACDWTSEDLDAQADIRRSRSIPDIDRATGFIGQSLCESGTRVGPFQE